MSDPVLEFSGVTKWYRAGSERIAAVSEANGRIMPGEVVALFGPSGSGKTTLLNLSATIDTPDEGVVSLIGRDTRLLSEEAREDIRGRDVGFVFQNFNLIMTLTALENVAFALAPVEPSMASRRARARIALSEVGLADRLHHLPRQMSGGQQQRTGIARALAKTPKIVFADEPSANLDSATTTELLALMKRMAAEKGVAFLICTHDPLVKQAADKRWAMQDGKLTTNV